MPESKRFLLRLDPKLFEVLRRWADDELRSINAQIEFLLTDQARRAGRLSRESGRPSPTHGPAAIDEFADDVNDSVTPATARRRAQAGDA